MGDLLDELNAEIAAAPKQAIAKVSYTHDGMIDTIIANPMISQGQLAAHYGYSQSWICQVMASDAFQARMATRREEVLDPVIRASVEERFKALVIRSQEILLEKLALPAQQVPDNLVLRTVEVASRALGYGAKQEAQPPAPTYDRLDQLGDRLINLLDKQRSVINGQAVEAQVTYPQGGPESGPALSPAGADASDGKQSDSAA